MIRFRQATLRVRDDGGIAMVTVIAVTSILAILMVAAVSMAIGGVKKSRNDQDWNAALAAAYAAAEEYQSRLADNPRYWEYGNPLSTFSTRGGTIVPKLTLPTGSRVNPAFGIGASGSWAIVGNSNEDDDGSTAYFRYEVDSSTYNSKGLIELRATGRVGGETRSIVAHLRQSGFLDFVYFTDFEYRDPFLTGASATSCNGTKRKWETGYNCGSFKIQFAPGDVLDGPVHSNDTIYTCSARYKEKVSTGAPSDSWDLAPSCAQPKWDAGPPTTVPLISMPETNDVMQRYTRADLTSDDVPVAGCMYTGPTKVTLNADGTMTVRSPWTKFTNVTGDDLKGGVTNNACGTIAALQSAAGAKVPVPKTNVVYVQNIPGAGNANYTAESTTTDSPWFGSKACKNVNGSRRSLGNIVGYPSDSNERVPSAGTDADSSYGCRNGDLFIEGTLSGTSVTFAAQNYIYLTGDVRYATNQPDTKLGLIGTNAVWVWNPMTSGGSPLIFSTTNKNRRIDGAVMSVQHSFGVQNYDRGDFRLGDLTIYGALVQKYRGTVGTSGGGGGTGFDKDYRYDSDFKYNPPPKFLSPTNSVFGVKTWIEVKPVFGVDGNYR